MITPPVTAWQTSFAQMWSVRSIRWMSGSSDVLDALDGGFSRQPRRTGAVARRVVGLVLRHAVRDRPARGRGVADHHHLEPRVAEPLQDVGPSLRVGVVAGLARLAHGRCRDPVGHHHRVGLGGDDRRWWPCPPSGGTLACAPWSRAPGRRAGSRTARRGRCRPASRSSSRASSQGREPLAGVRVAEQGHVGLAALHPERAAHLGEPGQVGPAVLAAGDVRVGVGLVGRRVGGSRHDLGVGDLGAVRPGVQGGGAEAGTALGQGLAELGLRLRLAAVHLELGHPRQGEHHDHARGAEQERLAERLAPLRRAEPVLDVLLGESPRAPG